MRIFNIMMSRKLGGVEQSFLDYGMVLENCKFINVTSSFAKINTKVKSIKLPNLFPWCILSKIYLWVLVLCYKPDVMIAHGGRAIKFALFASRATNSKVIGISHGYSIKHILRCDYIIALDDSLRKHFIKHGFRPSNIFVAPNMITVNHEPKTLDISQKTTFSIGSLGRFELDKGFTYLIEAIKILRDKNYDVNLKIGGTGSLEADLKKQVNNLNLQNNIEFLGWIEDKDKFFKDIDIFCIPSIFETFGIVALEAMSISLPIVSSNAFGLKNILKDGETAIIVETNSAKEIARGIVKLIDNPDLAMTIGRNAYQEILSKYDAKKVSSDIIKIIEKIAT